MEMIYYTSYELSQKMKNTAIIPIGSLEQHGPHLPLGTDAIIPFELAKIISKKYDVVIAPPIFYGRSYYHRSFSGTISIRGEILVEFIKDVLSEFARNGFKKIILMNGHGGNVPSITLAIEKNYREKSTYGAKIFLINWWELPNVQSMVNGEKDFHAGKLETSVMLALGYEVKNELIDEKHVSNPFEMLDDVGQFTKSGVIGSPTKASKPEGYKIIEEVVAKVVEIINARDD